MKILYYLYIPTLEVLYLLLHIFKLKVQDFDLLASASALGLGHDLGHCRVG
jgi:hypothetical protein